MNNNSSTDTQSQLSENTTSIAPSVAMNREAKDIDFQDALDTLREGIDGYGDRISASAAVLRATNELDIEANLLKHPRVEQAIWRYEHAPDRIRRQIELTIERESITTTVDEAVAAFCIAAIRLDTPIETD